MFPNKKRFPYFLFTGLNVFFSSFIVHSLFFHTQVSVGTALSIEKAGYVVSIHNNKRTNEMFLTFFIFLILFKFFFIQIYFFTVSSFDFV